MVLLQEAPFSDELLDSRTGVVVEKLYSDIVETSVRQHPASVSPGPAKSILEVPRLLKILKIVLILI